jgi:predicted GNAT family N-acyltransferase
MLGVWRDARGGGLARRLIDEVVCLSVEHPISEAVCLSTESPDNLPFYSHLGFEVIGHVRVDDLESWTLIRSAG